MANVLWLVGSATAFVSEYIYILILGRVLKGLTIGLITYLVPLYVTEIFPADRRGKAISVFHISTTLGTILMFFMGHFLEANPPNIEVYPFKLSWAIEGGFAVVSMILSLSLPESPKWLASKQKWIKAAKTLQRVRTVKRSNSESNDRDYVTRAYTAGHHIKYANFADLFKRKYIRQTAVGLLLNVFIQLTSVTSLMYFFTFICDSCGLQDDTKFVVVSVQYALLALLTVVPLVVLDGARRVDLLTYGISIMGLTYLGLFLVGLLYSFKADSIGSPFTWAFEREPASAVLALFLFLVSVYASSIASVSWLYIGEIFSDEARAKGMAVCTCLAWVVNSITTIVLPLSFQLVEYWVFLALAVFCVGGAVAFSMFPETKSLVSLVNTPFIEPLEDTEPQDTEKVDVFAATEDALMKVSTSDELTQEPVHSEKVSQKSPFFHTPPDWHTRADDETVMIQLQSNNSIALSEHVEADFNKKLYNSMKKKKLLITATDSTAPLSSSSFVSSDSSDTASFPRKRRFTDTISVPATGYTSGPNTVFKSAAPSPEKPQTLSAAASTVALDDIIEAYKSGEETQPKTLSPGELASCSEQSYFSNDWDSEESDRSHIRLQMGGSSHNFSSTTDESSSMRFPAPKNPLLPTVEAQKPSFFATAHLKSRDTELQRHRSPKRSKTNFLQST